MILKKTCKRLGLVHVKGFQNVISHREVNVCRAEYYTKIASDWHYGYSSTNCNSMTPKNHQIAGIHLS